MKKYLLIIALCLLICPLWTKAVSIKDYNTLNLEEALSDEDIEPDFTSYKETNRQITIYLFRGKGCAYCRAFLTFLNSITDEYGKYFKVVSFETWNDSKNNELLSEVSTFLGQKADGVPYIIIGDKVFPGYTANYDEDIKNAITDLYNSEDRYDVFEKMNNPESDEKEEKVNILPIIIWNLVFVLIGTISVVGFIQSENKKINARLDNIEKLCKRK